MSRPRTDQLERVERIAALLAAEPQASANAVYRRLGGRRQDVLRAVRALRVAQTPRHRAPGTFDRRAH